MYLRIKNELDVELLKNVQQLIKMDNTVISRISEIIKTLDDAYGMYRNSHSMGGYILLFTEKNEYQKNKERISAYYNIDTEAYEYSDDLGNGWCEDLYLLSSDDALVMLYQKG